jgi:two-component system, chemotaxis family, CheB/CheR fusion protein
MPILRRWGQDDGAPPEVFVMSVPTVPSDPELDPTIRHVGLGFPVVGIGTSAGGLAAVGRFLEAMPADPGMAIVVIMHLSPRHESIADRLLRKSTSMRVVQVTESVPLEENTVYVIPPRKSLSMSDGHLRLVDLPRMHGKQIAIDFFFRTLAEVHRSMAIAVILTGTGADGSVGIARIRERGGVTLVQHPDDAEFDQMPRAAISTGATDIVLPLPELAARVVALARDAREIRLPDMGPPPESGMDSASVAPPSAVDENALRDIMLVLQMSTTHDFRQYKRATVLRRIERRMQVNGLATLPAYRDFLNEHVHERPALLKDMLISVTNFFRDREVFDALEEIVVPLLVADTARTTGIRAWSAGCASGEEAYSLAMLLEEAAAPHGLPMQVFATDIDEEAIAHARRGCYPSAVGNDIGPDRMARFLVSEDNFVRVIQPLRERVLFARHNVLQDPPFSRLDLIVCRNLLIYLNREAQARVLELFHFALRPGGYLLLGSSESSDAAPELFSPMDRKNRLFQANDAAHGRLYLHRPAPQLPVRPLIEPRSYVEAAAEPDAIDKDDLKSIREQLRQRITESETTTEELMVSNEELQSMNEELRSATEELETSKEELQSVNEEMSTVNHELKLKIDDTAKANDDLHNLVASTDIATIFVDRDLRIKRFTPRARDVFRLIAADLGQPLLDINHVLEYPELTADVMLVLHSLQTIEREVGSRDGRWYIARILPYRTAEERPEGAVMTFIDITRRRNAEQAARSSEERMRLVAESAVDYAIITTDAQGVITSWSRGAEKTFLFPATEAIGRHGDLIFTPEDRARGAFGLEMEMARIHGRANDDRWHLRSDGARIFCSGTTTPLQHGGTGGFAKIARDVTLDKEREREREELLVAEKASRERAQCAIELKDEFLAVMSHELKHPLNLILMNAELVGRAAVAAGDAGLRRASDAIRKTVVGQAQIIDDLLDLSRINTGKLTLSLGEVDLTACVQRIADGMAENLARRNITLTLDLPARHVMLTADATRVEQVIWNLLSNAAKFSNADGNIAVTMVVGGDAVTLCVTDDGIGMSPDIVHRAFEMFEQGVNRRNNSAGGLGIGLALVRHLVELHGGTVAVHSDGPGTGARFTVRWPLVSLVGDNAASEIEGVCPPGLLLGRRILIVDDSEELLIPFAQLLTMEGAEVTAVESALQALDALAHGQFDTLLSDIGMPGMDGHELIARVRAEPRTRDIVAVALTGFGRSQDQTKALQAGFDAHLSKPVSMRALMNALSRVAQRRASEPAG